MLGAKTRDLIVETATIIRGLRKDFVTHVDNEDKKIDRLYDAIKECHDECPERERFDEHTKAQNGTLLRMEKKYDTFYEQHTEMKDTVHDMKFAKKTIYDLLKQAGMIIATAGVVTGIVFGMLRYTNSKKPVIDTVKIERMLEEIIDKD